MLMKFESLPVGARFQLRDNKETMFMKIQVHTYDSDRRNCIVIPESITYPNSPFKVGYTYLIASNDMLVEVPN